MTHQIHKRMPDGIHWTQDAVRLQLNIILTHFCLSRDIKLPGRQVNFYSRKLAILVFSAFGHRGLAKQVTLKVRLSGNLNTLPNTAFLTA